MKKILIAFYSVLLCLMLAGPGWGAVEDFSTYTEQDGYGSAITVTTSRVSWSSATVRSADYWVVSDKGVGYFGDFKHEITVKQISQTTAGQTTFWAVSNTLGDTKDMQTATNGICLLNYGNDGNLTLTDLNTGQSDEFTGTLNTVYYLTIERIGTTCTAKFYSDSGKTTLLDTLSITCASTTLRYVYAMTGYNTSGSGGEISAGYSENFTLGLPSTTTSRNSVIDE